MSVDYGVKDIKTLEGIEAIRLRPGIRYGKWDHMGNCSYCNKNIYKDIDGTIYSCYEPPFCPNCGAQMYEELPAAADNNCDASGISKVCNGSRNKCGGFKWKYLIM